MEIEKELNSIISKKETKSVKDLYELRKEILETINAEIKRKKEANRNRKKKIVRPRMYISDSSSDEEQEVSH